jgi:hypothetical protein
MMNKTNPKPEIRNPKQIPMTKIQNSKPGWHQSAIGFEHLNLGF